MLSELIALLKYNYNRIDFIDEPVRLGFDCPLDLHCTYTRDQLLVAMDFMKPSTVREGVKWLPDKEIDVFFITLNKSDKDYSPTTMYQDYSINETLFIGKVKARPMQKVKSVSGISIIAKTAARFSCLCANLRMMFTAILHRTLILVLQIMFHITVQDR